MTGPKRRDLDVLAAVAVLIALVLMPVLGIGHALTHVAVVVTVIAFAWLLGGTESWWQRLDLVADRRGWLWVALVAALSGVVRWWLDEKVLGGRGGIGFYRDLFRQYGLIDPLGEPRWAVLAAYAPVLLAVIVLDGIFFSGLIQRRVAVHTNVHVGVVIQAILFALPHTFAGSVPDVAYGVGTFIGGVVYGYVYHRYRNQWLPAFLLWGHVITVWVIMLAVGAVDG